MRGAAVPTGLMVAKEIPGYDAKAAERYPDAVAAVVDRDQPPPDRQGLVLFFTGLLVSTWLHLGLLAGASFLAGTVVAAWYTKQRDLLTVAVSPPLLFFFALVCVKALTATGSTAGPRALPLSRVGITTPGWQVPPTTAS